MMRNDLPKTIYLKDYRPPDFQIEHVSLRIELDPDRTLVEATSRVVALGPDPMGSRPLVLDGHDMELVSVQVDGRLLSKSEYRLEDEQLVIPEVPATFDLAITTRLNPAANTSLEGLYVSSGKFYTQCEAEGFRKITYYLDRPDVMTRFRTTLIADRVNYPVLLSNGNLVEQGEMEDGRHFATWEDPYKKPSYLFALVAGDLACLEDAYVTGSGRNIALKLFVEAHDLDKTRHAMDSLKRAMRWDEDRFGLEYDLDIYMIVAVGDFNMGAMENKGLNIFNTAYTLAKAETATDTDFENIEGVIGHEYFHNWTGNRVTCRDWFQLSLKEGLTVFRDQEFTADMTSRAVKRIQDVRMLRARQFPEDAGPMAHPVRPDAYVEINNFYTVTVYEKGAEVVRMYQTLLGREGFRKGMDLYFQRHDGQAVTTDDFRAAMADANNIDLVQFARWYSQAGTPVLRFRGEYDSNNKTYSLHLYQSCSERKTQPENKPFHIPVAVGLLNSAGEDMVLQMEGETGPGATTRVLELTSEAQTFTFMNVPCEPVPSVLRNFSAPVKLSSELSEETLAFLAAHDSDPFNRWDAGQQLAQRTMLKLIADQQAGKALLLDAGFVYAFKNTLTDERLDRALVAQAMVLPTEVELAEQMETADPDAIHVVREFVRSGLASAMAQELRTVYDTNRVSGEYSYNQVDAGKRAIRNISLGYLAQLGGQEYVDLCMRQFQEANNMTDQIAALACLASRDCSERVQALEQFYEQWQGEALVVDKWFSLQATSALPGTSEHVASLLQHPAFNIKNPNKVRALIGSFAMRNPLHFHDSSGNAYHFVADRVIELNDINPQVASRMVTAFNRWKKYDSQRQGLMKKELERIQQHPGLSRDVQEIVSRALEG